VRLLLHWILSAIAVWIVAHVVPGISVSGPVAALIAYGATAQLSPEMQLLATVAGGVFMTGVHFLSKRLSVTSYGEFGVFLIVAMLFCEDVQ